jgi:hypothetical protein
MDGATGLDTRRGEMAATDAARHGSDAGSTGAPDVPVTTPDPLGGRPGFLGSDQVGNPQGLRHGVGKAASGRKALSLIAAAPSVFSCR